MEPREDLLARAGTIHSSSPHGRAEQHIVMAVHHHQTGRNEVVQGICSEKLHEGGITGGTVSSKKMCRSPNLRYL